MLVESLFTRVAKGKLYNFWKFCEKFTKFLEYLQNLLEISTSLQPYSSHPNSNHCGLNVFICIYIICERRRTLKCSSNHIPRFKGYDSLSIYVFSYLCTLFAQTYVIIAFHYAIFCVFYCNDFSPVNETWGNPTLSHGNSYVFYELANSYEFVRPHSYDLSKPPLMGRFRGGVRCRSFVLIHTNWQLVKYVRFSKNRMNLYEWARTNSYELATS